MRGTMMMRRPVMMRGIVMVRLAVIVRGSMVTLRSVMVRRVMMMSADGLMRRAVIVRMCVPNVDPSMTYVRHRREWRRRRLGLGSNRSRLRHGLLLRLRGQRLLCWRRRLVGWSLLCAQRRSENRQREG